ncbi:MAG: signal peptidase I [Candidatus Levybacteria bacterium]|nr:signal peptidase I [Candidatus Levybacteria bacterium]
MEKENIQKKSPGWLSDTLQTFLMALAIFSVIYFFVARPFQVSGESMYPTYKDKEYVFTNIVGLKLGELKRGDVVVFEAPTDHSRDFIKRVIGFEGESIELRDGYVFLNGKKLNENTYLPADTRTYGGSFLNDKEKITIPKDHVFVMGDNRQSSSDSREWGFLNKKDVIGKTFLVYWPISEAHFVQNPF